MRSALASICTLWLFLHFHILLSQCTEANANILSGNSARIEPSQSVVLQKFSSELQKGQPINISNILVNTTTLQQDLYKAIDFQWSKSEKAWSTLVKQFSQQTLQSLKTGLEYASTNENTFDGQFITSQQPENTTARFSEVKEDSAEEVAGVTAAVYQDFLTKASAVAVQLLEDNFEKVKLDSVTAIAQVPVIGPFQIKLENVQLEGLKLDKTTTGVSLGDDGTFDLVISNLDAIVTGHFQWRRTRFPFISGGCQAQVTAVNGNVRLRVAVVGDESGRPKIADMDAAQLSFDNLSIVTSGAKLSWLYNAVAAFAHTQIQEAITKAVSAQVSTTVPGQINHLLDGVPTIVNVKGLELNTSLVKSPEVTPERLIVWDWGRFQNPEHKLQVCPFVRKAEMNGGEAPILPGGSPYQVIADIDESIVNCLTWDMYKKGKLHALLQGDDLPEKALYTDTWRLVIPAVYNMCPGCPMVVNATVTKAPSTLIQSSKGIISKGSAELSFFLAEKSSPSVPWTPVGSSDEKLPAEEDIASRKLLSDEKLDGQQVSHQVAQFADEGFQVGDHLFTLSLSGELAVQDLTLDQDSANGWRINLSMKINQNALAVSVVQSDVGEINEAALHFALTVASFLVEDKVNHGILADGFPLPDIPHVKVDRANVTVVEHALALGADFSYKP